MCEILSKVTEVAIEKGPIGANEKLKDGWVLIDTHDNYLYDNGKTYKEHLFTVGKIPKD
jgi:hypothetical protein